MSESLTTRLTHAQHRERHVELHRCLDELVADFLGHNPESLPSQTTVMQLMQWSHSQTIAPTSMPT